MGNYRRGDRAPLAIDPDSDYGKDLGLNDHLLPAGIPHISNKAVVQQEAPDVAPRPEYRGHMAHGVAAPQAADVAQERQPYSEIHREQAMEGLATFTDPGPHVPEQTRPIDVRVVQESGGHAPFRAASFLHYVIPPAGSYPVRICGRDVHRSRVHLINETTPPAAIYTAPGTYTGATGSISAPTAGTIITGATIWLPSGSYTIGWTAGFSAGTPAGADDNNFELMSPTATQLAVSVNVHGATPVTYPQAAVQLTVPTGGQLVTVKAIGNATAGVTYTATITATLNSASYAAAGVTQGTVTGPTAGAVIGGAAQQNSADLGAGSYLVGWNVILGGTMTAAETCNFGLYLGTTLLAISNNPNFVLNYPQTPVLVTVPAAGGILTVKAIANAGGSAVYTAQMSIVYQPVTPPVPGVRVATFPGDLAADLANGYTLSGALILPGQRLPLNTQEELFAVAESTNAQATLTVIQEYEIPRPAAA